MDSGPAPKVIMAAPVMPLREPSREVLDEARARELASANERNDRRKLGLCAVGVAFVAACAIVIFAMNRATDVTSRPEITSAEIIVPAPPSTIALPLPVTEPAPPPPQPSSISASVTPPPPMRVRRRGPPRPAPTPAPTQIQAPR